MKSDTDARTSGKAFYALIQESLIIVGVDLNIENIALRTSIDDAVQ
jgi:hypothetical protein